MSNRDVSIASIVSIIADYRQGDIPARSASDVDRWVRQFPDAVQDGILSEMSHVLQTTYLSRKKVINFLRGVMNTQRLVGDDPQSFWRNANLLNIQAGGASQREMLALFKALLRSELGVENVGCPNSHIYIYLDDGIFTGNRVQSDLAGWINSAAPSNAKLHVIASAVHRGGEYYAETRVNTAKQNAGKNGIKVTWWHAAHLEDRKRYTDNSDVLRPSSIPNDTLVKQYVSAMSHKPHLRQGQNVGAGGIFSSGAGRKLLEQEFLKAGAKIRSVCPTSDIRSDPWGT